jgi:hypothetical protein
MSEVVAKLLPNDVDWIDPSSPNHFPGAFKWWRREEGGPPTRLTFLCPCGCGTPAGVAVAKDMNDRGGNHPVWQWDGNIEKPTITPSIQIIGGCGWHGYLTAGVFRTC